MTTNKKGRAGGHQATLTISKRTYNSTGLPAQVKGIIITLAFWGWPPVTVADRLINLGGPRGE